jgi:Flp pilus assembly protein TadD
MGELYFQALATNQQDYMTLARDYSDKLLNLSIGFFRYRLRHDPADVEANIRLGRILMAQGEKDQGAALLMKAVAADPNSDQAHYELGLWHLGRKDLDSAFAEFQTASRLNPGDSQALGNLGYIALRRGQYAEAVNYFENALQVNPEDEIARKYLLQLRQVR